MPQIAVGADGPGLDATVSANFARGEFFVLVDVDTLDWVNLPNPLAAAKEGAGREAAVLVAQHLPAAMLTRRIGPNAFEILAEAGIPVFAAGAGTVREAVSAYRAAHLSPLPEANSVARMAVRKLDEVHANVRDATGRKRNNASPTWRQSAHLELARLREREQHLTEQVKTLRRRIAELEDDSPKA